MATPKGDNNEHHNFDNNMQARRGSGNRPLNTSQKKVIIHTAEDPDLGSLGGAPINNIGSVKNTMNNPLRKQLTIMTKSKTAAKKNNLFMNLSAAMALDELEFPNDLGKSHMVFDHHNISPKYNG